MGWEKYEVQILNHEEELWNMELPKASNELEKKVVQYSARHPDYFDNEKFLLESQIVTSSFRVQ